MVTHPVMDWLAAGLPLALLMDLAGDEVPKSYEILCTEGRRPGGGNVDDSGTARPMRALAQAYAHSASTPGSVRGQSVAQPSWSRRG